MTKSYIPYFLNQPDFRIPQNITTDILKEKDALAFHLSLAEYQHTPLISLPALAKHLGIGKLFVKDESKRFGLNAFKGLGASFAVFQILQDKPDMKVFCTATDGNHGRAVAWAAQKFGKEAVVFVPSDTTSNRIQAIEKEGAKVIQLNKNYDDTCAYAEEMSIKNNWELVQDTAWEGYETIPALIMAGYLTQFKELETDLHPREFPEVDVVFLQVGVGSWAGAAAYYYLQRYSSKGPALISVEPEGSSGLLDSFRSSQRVVPNNPSYTIMAGLNCGIPSLSGWELLKNAISVSLNIPDIQVEEAIRCLYYPLEDDPRIISGESGAAGLAGLLAMMQDPVFQPVRQQLDIGPHSRILVFNTEGDTDKESFQKIIS
ncbi:diaminopropionate ammonia-lyase [Cecembia rubra]|nr:diaminopropionate ammonia-lyase [Cecembia rubra]